MKSVIIRDIRNGETIAEVKETKTGAKARVIKLLVTRLEITIVSQKGKTIKIYP